jgi:hypothetical protein
MVLVRIETVRDWVVIAAAILWALLTLVLAVVLALAAWYARKGMRAASRALTTGVRPQLAAVHARLADLRDRTARLPGNVPLPEGTARPVPARRRRPALRWPFRRRRRWPFG